MHSAKSNIRDASCDGRSVVRSVRLGLAAAALLAIAGPVAAFSPMRFVTPGGNVPRWSRSALPLNFEVRGSATQRASTIESSLARWTRMPSLDLPMQVTRQKSSSGTTIPVFDSPRLPAGAAAVTAFDLDGRGNYRIAQIAVNSRSQMSTGAYELAVTHEMGHAFGLNHSDRIGAVMNSFLERRQLGLAPHYDDWAGACFLYGDAKFASGKGGVAGTVRAGGRPVDNLDVVIRQAGTGALAGVVRTGMVARGDEAADGQGRAQGEYSLVGLPPGKYLVVALNSRLTFDGRLNPRSVNAAVRISPVYHGGATRWQDAKAIEVQAGQIARGIDIEASGTAVQQSYGVAGTCPGQ